MPAMSEAVIQLAILKDTLLTSNQRLHWRPKADRILAGVSI